MSNWTHLFVGSAQGLPLRYKPHRFLLLNQNLNLPLFPCLPLLRHFVRVRVLRELLDWLGNGLSFGGSLSAAGD